MWQMIESSLSERVYKFRPLLTQTWSLSSRMVVFATPTHLMSSREFIIIKPFRWGIGWSPWDEYIAPDGVICRSFRCDKDGDISMTDERHVAVEDIHIHVMPWILRLIRPVHQPKPSSLTKSLMFRCFCCLPTNDIVAIRSLMLPYPF